MYEETTSAASRYGDFERHRTNVLQRARDCSRLTIPSLVPESDFNEDSELPTPYQSLGARGVNNLASKLLLALLPPSSTFFRLTMTEKVLSQLSADVGPNGEPSQRSQFELALSQFEQKVLAKIETLGVRVHAFEAFKHLIVAGNVLLHFDKKAVRVFPLSQYVVRRDAKGTVLEIIIKECVSPEMLPDGIRLEIQQKMKPEERDVDLYTWVRYDDITKQYKVKQQCYDLDVPDSEGTYPKDKLPWLALRWTRIDGQDYGRSHCEEYLGDLASVDKLEASVLDCAAIAARILFLINPNSDTDPEDVEQAENGACIPGKADDITVLQANKFADLQITSAQLEKIEQRLNYAFLLNSAVQRQAERVTAEEVRYMARELEDTLGGVYSVMSIEFQLPMVQLVIAMMERGKELPVLPKDGVKPTIVTGMDALGRNHELARLDAFVSDVLGKFGPQAAERYINMSEYFARRAAATGVDSKGLIRSAEQLAAMDAQAAQQAAVEKLGPSYIKAASDQMTAQQQQQQQTATE